MENSINEKVKKYFEADKKVSKESLEIITWFIYQLEENRQHDLWLIAKILPEKYSANLVSYFDGDYIKFPTKEQYIELRLLSVCFFLKEIQGWGWDQIKTFLNINEKDNESFSPISLGNKINKIKEYLVEDIKKILNKCEVKDDFYILKSYVNDLKKEKKKVINNGRKRKKRK